MAVKVSKVWPVEKYARFVTDSQQAVLLQKDARKGGAWQVSVMFCANKTILFCRLNKFPISLSCSTIRQRKVGYSWLW